MSHQAKCFTCCKEATLCRGIHVPYAPRSHWFPKDDSVDGQNIGTPNKQPPGKPPPPIPRYQCCLSTGSMRRGPNILSIRRPSHFAHNIDIGGTGGLTHVTPGVSIFCPSTVLVPMLFGPAKLQHLRARPDAPRMCATAARDLATYTTILEHADSWRQGIFEFPREPPTAQDFALGNQAAQRPSRAVEPRGPGGRGGGCGRGRGGEGEVTSSKPVQYQFKTSSKPNSKPNSKLTLLSFREWRRNFC